MMGSWKGEHRGKDGVQKSMGVEVVLREVCGWCAVRGSVGVRMGVYGCVSVWVSVSVGGECVRVGVCTCGSVCVCERVRE